MAGTAIWTGTCPHCGRENTGFTSIAQNLVKTERHASNTLLWNVFFVCNACNGGVVASVRGVGERVGPDGLEMHVAIPGRYAGIRGTVEYSVLEVLPKAPSHEAPQDSPDKVAAAYIEASENLHRRKYETSQMLSRKALDLATKRLLPGSKKMLYGRIEELRDAGKITPEMADWAHIVRDEGNNSVHDETEVSREEAVELLAFTETFLMYAFTLPGMIQRRRQDAALLPDAGQSAG